MKKWNQRVSDILNTFGLTTKVKENTMTNEDWSKFNTEYQQKYGISFSDDREANEDAEPETPLLSAEQQQEIASVLNVSTDKAPKTAPEATTALTAQVKEQQAVITQLSDTPESEKPTTQQPTMKKLLGQGHTPTHLFGIEDTKFARSNWWCDLTASRKEITESELDENQVRSFKSAFREQAQSLASRFEELNDNNLIGALDYKAMAAGNSVIDYSQLDGTAGEYITRRNDAVIAYLRTLPTVGHLFPVISNVQNKELAPTVHFGELSQGYRKGRIFKGSTAFAAEIYKVEDCMFKYEFADLIKLEKKYIGYLNTEGSSIIKWTFIEWLMISFIEILHSEEQRRRIIGVRVPQQSVVANPAVFAADGILRAIERAEEEFKVLPFEEFGVYTSATMVDTFEAFWDEISQVIPSMTGMKFYANLKHRNWYVKGFREKYGKDNDFTGVKEGLQDLSPEQIQWVPNMERNDYKFWITMHGNVNNLQHLPSDMMNFKFTQEFESVLVNSRWKGGAVVLTPGVKYKDKAELEASGRENQYIFTNYPASELAADAATINGKLNTLFVTAANTAAKKITNIENASIDRVYKIVCGSTTNATGIDKSGKFAKIASAWTPTKVGAWIKVYAELEDYSVELDGETCTATRPTGNFLELERFNG